MPTTKTLTLKLSSPAFKHNGRIPKANTCDGADDSPALTWSGAPRGTKTLALIMEDPDAPAGTWVHWVIYDVPADEGELAAGMPKVETLANGASQGQCWGVDSFERVGYYGPCPPPGNPHRYSFKLYALDAKLGLPPAKTKEELLDAMVGHVLAQGELVGLYGRRDDGTARFT